MKIRSVIIAATAALSLTWTATAAQADPLDNTQQELIDRANAMTITTDKAAGVRTKATSKAAQGEATGTYPQRKGVMLVTPDKFKNLIPTGHAAIIYDPGTVVEALSSGVQKGENRWYETKSQAYAVTVSSTTPSQDAWAADWAHSQIGKPYNFNYLSVNTRSKFYCSHLLWAAYKDGYGIDLNTSAWGRAVHPMELVNSNHTELVWRKA